MVLSALLKINLLVSKSKHMLRILKRTSKVDRKRGAGVRTPLEKSQVAICFLTYTGTDPLQEEAIGPKGVQLFHEGGLKRPSVEYVEDLK